MFQGKVFDLPHNLKTQIDTSHESNQLKREAQIVIVNYNFKL